MQFVYVYLGLVLHIIFIMSRE